MKGDRVIVWVDAGAEATLDFTIEATRNGRKVEVDAGRVVTTVTELMHTGKVVRTCRFLTARVVALIEEPAEEPVEEPESSDRKPEQSLFETQT